MAASSVSPLAKYKLVRAIDLMHPKFTVAEYKESITPIEECAGISRRPVCWKDQHNHTIYVR